VARGAVKEVLERNGLDGYGKPVTAQAFAPPTQRTTFNMSAVKFDELSDEGLDLVGQVLKAMVVAPQPLIDVPKRVEGRRS
jgi:hypothetical protein